MRRLAIVTAPGALLLLAVACASPPSRFYALSASPPPAAAPADLSVVVNPVIIPAAVDRAQMVISVGPNQARVDEFNRWVGPLQNGIARVVAENLVALLGTSRVSVSTMTMPLVVDYRVAIDVQRFDSALGEAATLDAFWTITRARDGKSQTGRTSLREPATAAGYDAVVAAHSRALERLSRDIAAGVQGLARTP